MSISPSGPVDPTQPPHRGPGRAARVLRALFRKAKSCVKSRATSCHVKALRQMPLLHPIRDRLHHHRAEMHQLWQRKRQVDTAALLRCLCVTDLIGLHLCQHGA